MSEPERSIVVKGRKIREWTELGTDPRYPVYITEYALDMPFMLGPLFVNPPISLVESTAYLDDPKQG